MARKHLNELCLGKASCQNEWWNPIVRMEMFFCAGLAVVLGRCGTVRSVKSYDAVPGCLMLHLSHVLLCSFWYNFFG